MGSYVDVLKAIGGDRLELGPVAGTLDGETGKCWRRGRDTDGVDWLLLDLPGSSANLVNEQMLTELDLHLADIERSRPKAVAVRSAKRNGFIAGADVNQFHGATDASALGADLAKAHAIVNRLAALPMPTIAVIHGFCLGGGLELALACRYRIAVSNAFLGFPEVQLGLHPGLGGTARLTRLIDPLEAMTMILTGRRKFAKAALAAGLVDVVTEERHVAAAVAAAATGKVSPRAKSGRAAVVNLAPVRWVAAGAMRRNAQARARPDHYPAPYAAIDLWSRHGGSAPRLRQAEIGSFARLCVGQTAQNLIGVFLLRERMKSFDKTAAPVRHVHVIGAGTMGADIAAWCALKGKSVTLADTKAEALAKAMARANRLFDHETHGSIERRDVVDRLIPDLRGVGVARADLVIEAVPENLDLKRKIHGGLEDRIKESAILATNTSSIRLEDIATALKRPERLVGIHFFNPVARMQLVEIIHGERSSQDVVAASTRFVADIDRLPAPVRSAPGFLVNRTLMPYLLEALLLIDEKVPKEVIDRAAEDFGMPVGPIELADDVGLDICLDVAKMLKKNLSQPVPDLPAWFEAKVKRGELGKKTGKGFYDYRDGKAAKAKPTGRSDAAFADRLILPLLNACAACLREKVVADPDTVDGALVFGAGFAPFRGGPMTYARARGFADIKKTLEGLAAQQGPRFAPDPYWDERSGG
ncbi:MAG TPA: 3-hydroxyacyl-CoA dehydrogenase NAD-binding domain-containing protein [Dongiaceae bacterium]|nr:3-hydroxyacyl-CoA dehydrogenase NAD-binding domain-containing protein [Dongiaceae bacterium]